MLVAFSTVTSHAAFISIDDFLNWEGLRKDNSHMLIYVMGVYDMWTTVSICAPAGIKAATLHAVATDYLMKTNMDADSSAAIGIARALSVKYPCKKKQVPSV